MMSKKPSIAEQLKGILIKECCICGAPLFTTCLVDGYGNMACNCHTQEIIYCASCSRMCEKDLNPIGADRFICSGCLPHIPDEQGCRKIVSYVRKVLADQGLLIPAFSLERVPAEKFLQLGHPAANGLDVKNGDSYKIYVLQELINTAMAEVIAHEMTHTWQWENNVTVRNDISEGFCNLASYIIVLRGIDTDMARIKVRNLKLNPDSIYDAGFRKVKEDYNKNRMDRTIKRMETRR